MNTCTKGSPPAAREKPKTGIPRYGGKIENPTQITHKPDLANFGALARAWAVLTPTSVKHVMAVCHNLMKTVEMAKGDPEIESQRRRGDR